MTQDTQTYYLHYDQVGTLRAVSDTNQNIIKEITYDTFGNILQDTNQNFKVPFGFAGGLHDRDTNLVHFGYREYDPLTGKWTAKDPIDFSGGDTNLYGYVLGDPVNFIDPTGLIVPALVYACALNPMCSAAVMGVGLGLYSYFNPPPAYYPTDDSYSDDDFYCAKSSKKSGKEKANDAPDWAKGNKPNPGESGKDFAERLLNSKYGSGNWRGTGPGSEYSRLKKWGDRGFK